MLAVRADAENWRRVRIGDGGGNLYHAAGEGFGALGICAQPGWPDGVTFGAGKSRTSLRSDRHLGPAMEDTWLNGLHFKHTEFAIVRFYVCARRSPRRNPSSSRPSDSNSTRTPPSVAPSSSPASVRSAPPVLCAIPPPRRSTFSRPRLCPPLRMAAPSASTGCAGCARRARAASSCTSTICARCPSAGSLPSTASAAMGMNACTFM